MNQKNLKLNKIIFLDMDGTCCESKQKITKEMKTALEAQNCPIIVVSGASGQQMQLQLDSLRCTILAQSGNCTPLWKNLLSKQQVWEVKDHIKKFGEPFNEEKFEHRGSQIAYSFVGHDAPQELKNKFDPKQKIRQSILKQFPFKSTTLRVSIAGTTCLDYTRKNGTKGKNIERWIKENKLNKKDCIFYGDALFKGGNDYSVRGIIKCVAVKSPADLLKKLCSNKLGKK